MLHFIHSPIPRYLARRRYLSPPILGLLHLCQTVAVHAALSLLHLLLFSIPFLLLFRSLQTVLLLILHRHRRFFNRIFLEAQNSNCTLEAASHSLNRSIMSSPREHPNIKDEFADMNLSIIGIGVEYPPHLLTAADLDTLCKRWYPESPAMTKVRAINNFTGIDSRSAVGDVDHPVANQLEAPSIDELCRVFLTDGVALAIKAAQKAISEAGLLPSDITHMVSTTCTNSANPGFDHFVIRGLGIKHSVEKVLLHGVGCAGGLAATRTAANLANGASYRGRKARILVVALEICSLLARSELDSIHSTQETRIGITLFGDCASALIVSNGNGGHEEPIYDILGWDHRIIPGTGDDLGFDVDPLGWKVILTPQVPKLAASAIEPVFNDLVTSIPSLPYPYNSTKSAAEYDWALHPGGSTILTGVERAMGVTPEHMRASYDTYINHGNSSSATVISVLDRLRQKDMDAPEFCPGGRKPRDHVIAAAFGPGIAVEMALLKRNLGFGGGTGLVGTGLVTPPPDSEGDIPSSAEASEDCGLGGLGSSTDVSDDGGLSEMLNGVELD